MLPDRGSAIAQGYAFLAHQDRQFSEARVDLDQCNFLFICGGSAEIGCEQLQQATTYSITPLGNVRFGSNPKSGHWLSVFGRPPRFSLGEKLASERRNGEA